MDDSKKDLESLIAQFGLAGTKEVLKSQGWTSFTRPDGAEVFVPPDGEGSITFTE